MPKFVSEITQGQTYEFSAGEGEVAASTSRVFRIIRESPTEYLNIPAICEINIGDQHPNEQGLYCVSLSAAYEGDSRMVVLATFSYRTTANAADSSGGGGGGQSSPPEIRPANWYTTTSLIEVPARSWGRIIGTSLYAGITPPVNPVGDIYDGVTKLQPVVTINVEQWESTDPTRHNLWAGCTNNSSLNVGSLFIPQRCLMFRGVQSKPAVENWGGQIRRGWNCTYEFLFKRNVQTYHNDSGAATEAPIGWDVIQPVTGFNVKAFTPSLVQTIKDNYGQPLATYSEEESNGTDKKYGMIKVPLALPSGIEVDDKVRAQVRTGVSGGFAGQRPSAQPIPLNADGTPRPETANPKVLVFRYVVTEEIDFSRFNLRLE